MSQRTTTFRGQRIDLFRLHFESCGVVDPSVAPMLIRALEIATAEGVPADEAIPRLCGILEIIGWHLARDDMEAAEARAHARPSAPKRKEPISSSLRTAVFERDAYRCRHCGDHRDLCADHIIPESRGGLTRLENLQTLCRGCNSRKGARPDLIPLPSCAEA